MWESIAPFQSENESVQLKSQFRKEAIMKPFYSVFRVVILIAMLIVTPGSAASAQTARTRGPGPQPQLQQANEAASRTNRIIVKFKDATGSLSSDEQARTAQILSAR